MKIVVLMGGVSAERVISFKSGFAVAKALASKGHAVTALDAADGSVVDFSGDPPTASRTPEEERATTFGALAGKTATATRLDTLAFLRAPAFVAADAVFNALHGGDGENGAIAAVLQMADKPCSSAGPMASAIAMNKAMTKRLMAYHDLPTAPWMLLSARALGGDWPTLAECEPLTLPLVVKPNSEGSSVGLTIVREAAQLVPAFEKSAACEDAILVEQYIEGRELTVTVLDGQPLPIVEIVPHSGLYDYESKYTKGKTRYDCPADLDEKTTQRVQRDAVALFRALELHGIARVDFRLGTDGIAYILEANTVPGLTETSLVPMAAAAAGVEFADLMQHLVVAALARD